MTVEKFLSFWSQHNTTIIEGLVALIILFSLFLAYRAFFVKKDISSSVGEESGQGVATAQLEKTLQKILDNQTQQASKSVRAKAQDPGLGRGMEEAEDLPAKTAGSAATTMATAGPSESAAEVAQLRLTLNESNQKIEDLQAQLQEALAAAQAATAAEAAGASEAGGNLSQVEREDLTGKLRDLEARLAEYEIISEDIADLSRYRDENEALKKELEALKVSGSAVVSAPESTAPKAATPDSAAVVPEPSGGASDESSNLIDDDLMKEFAAAVEGQKALDKVAEKAGDGANESAKNKDETNQLMDEFENFVTKKS